MALVSLARHAMATRFEIVLHGNDPVSLRAAGEEALDEIDRLEARLSLFRPSSEVAHLNARAAYESVRITPSLFALLQHAQKLHQETSGVFDITIAPLVRAWGFMGGSGHVPKPQDLAEAQARVGMHLVHLNPKEFSVEFEREGVMLDLGAIGKGYAIDRAAELLHEAGVESALLHGGTSTIYAIGGPPDANSWRIAIADPRNTKDSFWTWEQSGAKQESGPPLTLVDLRDQSLSVSAVWGKCFQANGQNFGHILDPRTGLPVTGALLSAVILPSATETDALSTALLILGTKGHEQITRLRAGMRMLVAGEKEGELVTRAKGISV
jgi:thiamine biosynthesis lipoprotein